MSPEQQPTHHEILYLKEEALEGLRDAIHAKPGTVAEILGRSRFIDKTKTVMRALPETGIFILEEGLEKTKPNSEINKEVLRFYSGKYLSIEATDYIRAHTKPALLKKFNLSPHPLQTALQRRGFAPTHIPGSGTRPTI